MKRSIQSSTDVRTYDLIVEIDYLNLGPDVVRSSDEHIDEVPRLVYAHWEAFLINMTNIFDKYGFEVKESHQSNRKDSLSQYHVVHPVGSNKDICYEVLIILRVSNHLLIQDIDNGTDHYKQYAQNNKYSKDKDFQDWVLEQILVNKQTTDSYARAIRNVKELVQTWRDAVSDS